MTNGARAQQGEAWDAFVSDFARDAPAGITWVLGAPATGKTTLANALHERNSSVRVVELGTMLAPLMLGGGRTPGGLELVRQAAELVRTAARATNERYVVFATQLPEVVLESKAGCTERFILLDVPAVDLALRRRSRADRQDSEEDRLDQWAANARSDARFVVVRAPDAPQSEEAP